MKQQPSKESVRVATALVARLIKDKRNLEFRGNLSPAERRKLLTLRELAGRIGVETLKN